MTRDTRHLKGELALKIQSALLSLRVEHTVRVALAPPSPSHRCVMLGQERTLSEPGSPSGLRPKVQPPGCGSVTYWVAVSDTGLAIMPDKGRSLGTWAERLPLHVHTRPRLTTSVLILTAGAVQDPVAPLRGADAGSRGAALYPGHRAFALHWQRDRRETQSAWEATKTPHTHHEFRRPLSGPQATGEAAFPPLFY